ncbi:hypothetical protein VTH82DRAFT_3957 [Thermothelomyces myriococcoides]
MEEEKKQMSPSIRPDNSSNKSEERPYTIVDHWKCLAACTLMSLCLFQTGLDSGLIGGFPAMVGFLKVFGYPDPKVPAGWNISSVREHLISSLVNLGAFFGALSTGPLANIISRRTGVWIASALCIISNIIMMSTTSIAALYVGRLVLGFSNGMFTTFPQLYINESTPARYRGLSISTFQAWISIGTLVGTIVDNSTAKIDGRNTYLIPLGLIYILPVLISLGLLLIPESPRWLAQQGKLDEARKSLRWHRPGTDTEVDREIRDIVAALGTEGARQKTVVPLDLFRNPVDRRRTMVGATVPGLQGASGAVYIIAYGTYFFQMADIGDTFQNSCILTTVGIVAILINGAVVIKFGRRRVFLMAGMLLCGLIHLLMAVVYTAKPSANSASEAVAALAVIYIFFYNSMVTTYAWISVGEIPSQRLRSYTMGLATAMGNFFMWLESFTAPYFMDSESLNWGPKYSYIWAAACCIACAWVFNDLPEVKNRTLEEIDEMFEAGLPTRKFRRYVCVGRRGEPTSDAPGSTSTDSEATEIQHQEASKV